MKMICVGRQDGMGSSCILHVQPPEIKAMSLLSAHSNHELKMEKKIMLLLYLLPSKELSGKHFHLQGIN